MKHLILPEQAKKLTRNYRSRKEDILKDDFKGKHILPISETFDRAAFDTLLAQRGCTGVRIYLGMDDDNLVRMIAVGVNNKGQDLLPDANQTDGYTAETGVIVEEGQRCPEFCPEPSYLNTDDKNTTA